MKPKFILRLALVLIGFLIVAAIWLMQKANSSASGTVKQAYLAANDGDLLRADAFLLPHFLRQITNLPPKGTTQSFWDYYTRTQSVARIVVLKETVKDTIPAATQFATINARIEFKDGQSRDDVILLAPGRKNRWQIYLVKNPNE
jgi:hypothetical protein